MVEENPSNVSNEAYFRHNLHQVRTMVAGNQRLDEVAHAIFLSLKPLDFLANIAEVIRDVEARLKRLSAVDNERMFQVSPTDFILISHQTENSFVALVTEIRMMLVRVVREYAPQAFFTIDQQDLIQVYSLGRHRVQIQDAIASLEAELPRMRSEHRGVRALTAEDIERVMHYIDHMPLDQFIDDFVAWQPVVRVRHEESPRVMFYEHYISMRKLQDKFLQGVNLFMNMNLFKLLTTELDKRILTCIRQEYINPARGSFNFNIESVLSAAFEQAGYAGHTKDMVVELQLSDVFADFERFRLAQTQAATLGTRLALDGLQPDMTDVLRGENMGCTFVKIRLDGAVPNSGEFAANVRRMLDAGVRVVGTRVESLTTLREASRMGIERFQGFYVNKLLRSETERERFMVG